MAVFCSSLTSRFPVMLLTYFLNNFEVVPVAAIITGITFVFTFHMRCISIVRFLLLLLLLLLQIFINKSVVYSVCYLAVSIVPYKDRVD
jgi:hypothetical protein